MAYWLMKSEPFKYSFAQLQRDKKTSWDGVRNHLAARHLRTMQKADEAFFYHSNEGLAIVGIVQITKTAYPDPSDETGKFVMVDVAPVRALARPVTLAEIKKDTQLKNMQLIKQSRLSVSAVTQDEWDRVLQLLEKTH